MAALTIAKIAGLSYNTSCIFYIAGIAQLVEHLIRNEGVVGSNPIIGSNEIKDLQLWLWVLNFCSSNV